MTHVCILHVHVCIDACICYKYHWPHDKLFFFCKSLWIKSHLASAKCFIVKKCKCTVYCLIIPQDCFEALAAAAGSKVTCKNSFQFFLAYSIAKQKKHRKIYSVFVKHVWKVRMIVKNGSVASSTLQMEKNAHSRTSNMMTSSGP